MTPHSTYSKVRVLVIDQRLHVFSVDENRQPVEIVNVEIAAMPSNAEGVLRFTTVDGEQWVVGSDPSGCGCGHPLKRINASDLVALVSS